MKKLLFSLVTASMMLSCSNSKSTLSKVERSISEDSKLSAVLWQQTSAEYEALCYQAFNAASDYLSLVDNDGLEASSKKKAIVMDLDETVLDNSPYNGWLIENNKSYSDETWREWCMFEKAEFVPGAADFIDLATNRGFKIIFISNRSAEDLEVTINNLEKEGIAVNQSDVLLKTSSSSKIERREKVFVDYNVVMLIGDNLADFNDQFDEAELNINQRKELIDKFKGQFGKKFIVLPNVMYGDWENTLKSNNNSDYIQNYNAYGLKKYIKTF
tara:strand:- start:117 stop:932 length:816 start_codon:yes stop_codon:yes gene_type:complete